MCQWQWWNPDISICCPHMDRSNVDHNHNDKRSTNNNDNDNDNNHNNRMWSLRSNCWVGKVGTVKKCSSRARQRRYLLPSARSWQTV